MTFKPLLLLDIDGVVADFVGASLECLGRDPATVVDGPDIIASLELSEGKAAYLRSQWCRADFHQTLKPYDGADRMLREVEQYYNITAVTTPMPGAKTWHDDRLHWLYNELGIDSVIFADDKSPIVGDVFVEDTLLNLVANRTPKKLLVNRPWNAKHKATADCYRIDFDALTSHLIWHAKTIGPVHGRQPIQQPQPQL